jgi:LuxR family maltose regulon positive regulatory protein
MDRFSPQLLEALATVEGEPSISRAELESMRGLELYREVPGLSDTWFAYHPLFQSALRRELERTTSGQTIAEVRRYAAAWFAGAGFVREAVTHLVAAGQIDEASALIESRLPEAFAREDWQSVASWLRSTPPEAIRQRPGLLLASAWVAYLSGRAPRMADVVSTMRDPGYGQLTTAEQQAEIALLADDGHDPLASIETAERAIALITPSKRYRFGYAHLALGMALISAGREDEALARLTAFTERESARIDAASIRGYFGRVVVLWQAGRLTRCAQIAADLLQLAAMNGLPISAGWGALHLGTIAHEQGSLAEASRHIGAVIADAERVHFLCVEEAFSLQVLVYEAQGLREEADRAVQRLRELAISSESISHLDHVDALIARTALIRGDLETARRWLATASPTLAQGDLKSPHNALLTRIKILIAVGSDDALREADRQLTEFVHAARTKNMALSLIEGLAVRALLHESRREHAAASHVLRESLELAAPEGIVQRYAYLGPGMAPILRRLLTEPMPPHHARAVLDALEGVLAAQPPTHPDEHAAASHAPTTHLLTDREIEVVRLLAMRLTNHEIGEELFISPITVKHHVANISGKLGVSGRRAAVARANELHLIP